ncbi:MerR family transcriptional regulator [Cohnella laeviribosi]
MTNWGCSNARTDEITGYRYYSAEQLFRLHRILAYKDLGFTLDHVCQLLV